VVRVCFFFFPPFLRYTNFPLCSPSAPVFVKYIRASTYCIIIRARTSREVFSTAWFYFYYINTVKIIRNLLSRCSRATGTVSIIRSDRYCRTTLITTETTKIRWLLFNLRDDTASSQLYFQATTTRRSDIMQSNGLCHNASLNKIYSVIRTFFFPDLYNTVSR